jgi:hypothetical protein
MTEYNEIMGNVTLADVIRYLKKLKSDEERREWFDRLKKTFCLECGTEQKDYRCQCWRDE